MPSTTLRSSTLGIWGHRCGRTTWKSRTSTLTSSTWRASTVDWCDGLECGIDLMLDSYRVPQG